MRVYLASPTNRTLCEAVKGMPVLLSFAICRRDYIDKEYAATFSRLLIDSGAYSEMNSGVAIDGAAYRDWWQRWIGHADAIAGLDDIRGDWRRSLRNYEKFGGFPTFHDSDPLELLDDLIPIAKERGGWLGLGLVPPREGKEKWVRAACDRVPDGVHIHGWALRRYTRVRRLDSVDSTNWWQDAMKLRTFPDLKHLTYGECLEIVVKRYQRWDRKIVDVASESAECPLFSGVAE